MLVYDWLVASTVMFILSNRSVSGVLVTWELHWRSSSCPVGVSTWEVWPMKALCRVLQEWSRNSPCLRVVFSSHCLLSALAFLSDLGLRTWIKLKHSLNDCSALFSGRCSRILSRAPGYTDNIASNNFHFSLKSEMKFWELL